MNSCGSDHAIQDRPLFHFAGPSDVQQRWSAESSTEGSEYEGKDALIHSLLTDES